MDGWRALSIALVLLEHASRTMWFPTAFIPFVQHGGLGVRFFFVISGFLITWLLLKENEFTGSVNLRNFYLRRALRIFPIYFLYLFVLSSLTSFSQSSYAWVANLTFTTDFYQEARATTHFWSLGVEEQFYLVWPVILFLVLRFASVRILAITLTIPLVAAPIARFLVWASHPQYLDFLFQGYSYFCNFDVLAYGCIAAVIFHRRPNVLKLIFEKGGLVAFLSGILLILIPIFIGRRHWIPSRLGEMVFISIQAIGFVFLLLHSVMCPQWPTYRFLNWNWVRHLGLLSYSTYIWQQMFWSSESVFGVKNAWWTVFPIWILIALLVAHVSYYLLERPLLGLRAKFRVA